MRAAGFCTLLVLLGCGGEEAGPIEGPALKVMTRNLYLGSDLTAIVMAPTVDAVPVEVAKLWKTVVDSDPPARLAAVADEIAATRPDLVGLQEVALFRWQEKSNFDFQDPKIDAEEVKFDFLVLLRAALVARGLEYQEVVAEHTDVELPGGPPDARFDVRLTDRDAILVRAGLAMTARPSVRYKMLTFPLPLSGGTKVMANLLRGMVSVQTTIDGVPFVFGNTHLEVGGGGGSSVGSILSAHQEAQAANLVEALAGISGTLVLLGDFNSSPDGRGTRSYASIAGKLTDSWKKVRPTDDGFTCCSSLDAPAFGARSRIDIVFYRGRVAATAAEVVGTDPAKRTASGLWPSDHAGVGTTLTIGR